MPLPLAECLQVLSAVANASALCSDLVELSDEGDFADFSHAADWINLGASAVCMVTAGLAAGLTMGVVSLDYLDLRIKERGESVAERYYAKRLLPLIKWVPRHQLLVTLLLLNSVANEALPLFLDKLVPPWCAILVSVTAVLVVGEILPSATFTGPAKLKIASRLSGLVWVAMALLSPLAYPLGWLLDRLIPEHDTLTSRGEVRALVDVQREIAAERGCSSTEAFLEDEADLVRAARCLFPIHCRPSPLLPTCTHCLGACVRACVTAGARRPDFPRSRESSWRTTAHPRPSLRTHTQVRGALSLSGKFVVDVMVPIEDVFAVSAAALVDEPMMTDLITRGHSRVPVHHGPDRTSCTSFLLLKEHLLLSPSDGTLVASLRSHAPIWVGPNASLFELLNSFQEGHAHMAFVSRHPDLAMRAQGIGEWPAGTSSCVGIVTLEDILEEILTEEIYDESDLSSAEHTINEFVRKVVKPRLSHKRARTTGSLPVTGSLPQPMTDAVNRWRSRSLRGKTLGARDLAATWTGPATSSAAPAPARRRTSSYSGPAPTSVAPPLAVPVNANQLNAPLLPVPSEEELEEGNDRGQSESGAHGPQARSM